jgi:hypothetical protein
MRTLGIGGRAKLGTFGFHNHEMSVAVELLLQKFMQSLTYISLQLTLHLLECKAMMYDEFSIQ